MKARRAALFLSVMLASNGSAWAHDFWIEPSTFRPTVGSELAIALRVGEHFRGEPVPRADPRIVKFILASEAGEKPIEGLPGTDPAGLLRIESPGLLVIGYRSHRSSITLEAERFEKYLAEEGLEKILEARRERAEHSKPGKEVYSRCAKAILIVGDRGRQVDRALGFTLECLLEKAPATWRPGAEIRLRVLHQGRPLAGALVKAISQAEPEKTLSARAGPDGRVAFRLERKGIWLVKTVHMIPAPKDTDADWESLWASVTFEVS